MLTFFSTGGSPVETSPGLSPPPYSGELGCGTPGCARASRQQAADSRQNTAIRHRNPGFLLTAFCIVPSAFRLLLSYLQLFQNFFFGFFNRHSIAPAVLIDGSVLKHVFPVITQDLNFEQRVLWRWRSVVGLWAGRFLFFRGLRCFIQ